MSRFHYFAQRHYGNNRAQREISEKDFVTLLSTEYCGHVTACGLVGIVTPDEEKAKKLVRSMKRSVVNIQVFSCGNYTLTFKKDRLPPKGRSRDSSKPDPTFKSALRGHRR